MNLFLHCLAVFMAVVSFAAGAEPNAVVAADGTGHYQTVQEAINAVPQTTSATSPWIIQIKPGIYKELIYVQREKRFVKLLGDDAAKTVLTYHLHAKMIGLDGKEIGTFRTPSTTIDADDFSAENITFENAAGPVGQALAIRIDGDRVAFRNCRFLGWQDTVFLNRGRQYFENCYLAGHVDFIFGGATAWFENCEIHSLKDGCLTAASTPPEQPYGFIFSHCKITGETPAVKAYLGRPWRPFASTIFLHCEISANVRPIGWNNWGKPEREQTVRYAEFANPGEGAKTNDRAPWSKQLTEAEAKIMTRDHVLSGPDHWQPTERP